ncbi:osmoprotectant transport system substrate-binding protein [Streptacidiphilus sp. MAP12-16]|uniref:glycine betaine ABC transporter substrate-binding protein n=1 Tax=Streptacidiphilus sp. MAP12-16 TaxID=3156300 RepID=UPI003516BEE9
MSAHRHHYLRPAALLTALSSLALAGCSTHVTTDSNSGAKAVVGAGSIKVDDSLKGQTLVVSSKDFSESIVLGEITKFALEAAGAKVTDKTNIKGSANTRAALVSKNVDMYWEYTGTGWIGYLKHTDPIKGAAAQFQAVSQEDLSKNGIQWLAPAPANNTYALAVRADKAQQWGIRSLSDLAAFAKTHPADATVCLESEFSTRNDGWPGVAKAYGIDIPKSNIKLVDTGVVYTETAKGTTCTFGEVFATDGRIANLKLTTLDDDKQFFPVYNPALTLRAETAQKYPAIAQIIAPIAAKLDNATLRELNADVDVKGETPDQVAQTWLKQQGFIG